MNLLNNYITLCILLQLLVEVKSQIILNPDLRYAHTITLIENRLYILGGGIPPRTNNSPPKESFIYLDVSAPFDTNKVRYIDFSKDNIVPAHRHSVSIKGGANNSTLFLYGGERFDNQKMELVYTFDTQQVKWDTPAITDIPPVGITFMFPVIDYRGLLYLFGGSVSGNFVNSMYTLDTINLIWKQVSSINAPSDRDGYGAVFLPNKNIIYIGGFGDSGWLPIDEVYIYNTISDTWETKKTGGTIPSVRAAFSAVLGLNGQRVIIFGGDTNTTSTRLLSPEDALYVLDINEFNWYVPTISGKIPSSRAFHKSIIVGSYMVVTFGLGYTRGVDNDILLLDISNDDEYVWTTSFVPSLTSQTPTTDPTLTPSTPSSQSNTVGIAIGTSIGIIGGIALTVGCFFLYKRYKNRKEQNIAIPTPGSAISKIK